MRIRQVLAVIATTAVALGGMVLVAPVASAASAPIVGRSGDLTAQPAGMPTTSAAARQIKKAAVTTSVRKDRTQATVVLRAVPTAADGARLRLTLGENIGGSCEGVVEYSTPTVGALGTGWSRTGATYTLRGTGESIYSSYDCAFAAITETGGITNTYDVLGGSLAPVYAQPKLVIKNAKLLGSKKLRLVPGVWTPIDVTVRNTGELKSGRVTVTGKGKALKVKKAKTGTALYDGGSDTVTVMVKLNKKAKKKATTLTLTAKSATAAKVTTKVTVKKRTAPTRIKDGTYASKDKNVNFRVKNGKLVSFRIYTMTTCGGYPSLPQYTWNYYSIPTTKIPKSGVIHVLERGSNPGYSAKLVGLASGKKLAKAQFNYNGPGRCWAADSFTATRVG